MDTKYTCTRTPSVHHHHLPMYFLDVDRSFVTHFYFPSTTRYHATKIIAHCEDNTAITESGINIFVQQSSTLSLQFRNEIKPLGTSTHNHFHFSIADSIHLLKYTSKALHWLVTL